MPRPSSFTVDEMRDRALRVFWRRGYGATSMGDLVSMAGLNRQAIYASFGGKRDLYLSCFERYQDTIVTPAFAPVEGPGRGLDAIRAYFAYQIDAADRLDLRGYGCFVANATAEIAPHDAAVRAHVAQHRARLTGGFAGALRQAAGSGPAGEAASVAPLAETLFVFATGLWTVARVESDGDRLRSSVGALLDMVEGRLS
ncbi:MAG: TetR/AcrR family transcriptional regulator [Pseudomonadota bacterium]